MTDTKSITLKFDVHLQPTGSRKGQRAVLGAFAVEGGKAATIETIKAQVTAAVTCPDLGAVVRVGLADDFVYVLHCGYDGTYRIDGFHPKPGECGSLTESVMRTFEKRVDAVEYFAEFVEQRHSHHDAVVEVHAAMAANGITLEGGALARLLGLPTAADAEWIRKTAAELVESSRVSKFSYSLADLRDCVGGADALETIDRAVEMWNREKTYTMEEAEEKLAEGGITAKGPLDAALAAWLHEDAFAGTLVAGALAEVYERKDEDGDTAETADPKLVAIIAAINRRHRLSSAHRRKRLRGEDYKTRVRAALSDKLCELTETVERLRDELHNRCDMPATLREELGL